MSSLRKHLSYANIVATLALLFAMSGAALAASHYLINSTKQINPNVLKQLKGRTGRTGPVGPQGTSGLQGPRGAEGSNGATGQKGEAGPKGETGLSALSVLPSGKSESGYYEMAQEATVGKAVAIGVTFPVPLAERALEGQVIYNPGPNGTSVHCSGPGHADRGFVCIYSAEAAGVETPLIFSYERPLTTGTGRLGFGMRWKATAVSAADGGTYTVTAG